jgi:hypothetical protein
MNAWISVLDRLPDDGLAVLVACPLAGEPVWIAYYDSEELFWRWPDGSVVPEMVTHWMDLPELPERTKRK